MPHSLSRDDVIDILNAFFVSKSRSPAIFLSSVEPPDTDAEVSWVPLILERNSVHEEDFVVFGHFADPASTILDIGANYGYSAASIWASGSSAAVLSFEPVKGYERMLRKIRRLRKGRFDFAITALGDRAGSIKLTTPVVNGRAAAGLSTARPVPNFDGLAANLFRSAAKRGVEITSLKFYQFTAPLMTLDQALEARSYRVGTQRIVAVKIDTEGFEAPIIAGATRTLNKHKPLLMLEGGHNPGINQMLSAMGYVLAARTGRSLYLTQTPVNSINGFYVHAERVAAYRVNGLVTGQEL